MELLLTYLALALIVSFLCSLLEASLLSVSAAYVSSLVEKGNSSAAVMQRYKRSPDRALAAILTCNTIAHTIGAAGVGAQAVELWGDQWLGLVSALLTLLILFLTEIVPKTLGSMNANRLVGFSARTIQAMILALFPLVWLAEKMSSRLGGGTAHLHVSRDEVAAMADMGKQGGELSPAEAKAIRNLLALRSIRVSDIMTPRPAVQSVDADMTLGEFAASESETPFARLPVTEGGDIDKVIGVIHRMMILDGFRAGQRDTRFRELARPLEAIPAAALVSNAMERLLGKREHMLLVVDEYGGTEGVVTLEDILETMLGVEIVDETDTVEDMREYARKLQHVRQAQRVAPRAHEAGAET
ncbi:MAG: HlyC/CorC family transporter [Planctomycetes bacterium]|nr:HlyC/CorC family transporter [Planctomycetota bacterium]